MPRLEIGKYETDTNYRVFIDTLIENKFVGGFCIFGGTLENLPIILAELQAKAKNIGSPMLLMSCDCEWGLPMRLHSGGTEFPHLMALERMGDQKGIKQVAQAIGIEMSALGLHWNFAPVADINSNPKNPIINIRSFSGDPEAVAECAQSFFEGLESAGIIATAKHFPGHGDTTIDSHRALPSINRSAKEFESTELLPFKHLAGIGIPSIMTGHIAAPKLAQSLGANEWEGNLPATISSFLTQKLLRETLNFNGVIITDSLEMYGLQQVINDTAEIAIRSVLAGTDILLMPTDPIAAFKGLSKAVTENRISKLTIEKIFSRLVVLRNKYINPDPPEISVEWRTHELIADNVAKSSLDIEGNIPKPLTPSSVLIIATGSKQELRQREILINFFSMVFPTIPLLILNGSRNNNEIRFGVKPLIITLFRPRGVLTEETLTNTVHHVVGELIKILENKGIQPLGAICIGDPYIAEDFIRLKSDFIIRTYSDSIPSVKAVLRFVQEYIN